ncbi:hypothetical protein BDN67DRAFT_1066601 [Paxillus ammoniavirescens]|nr:hypothetical protein BDN67DRAFT_1066601 [Paxillus ammoniavirescens]
MQLSNDLAALIGFACEAALWGAYSVLFVVSLIILGQRRLNESLTNPIVYLHCLIFLSCTTHFALEFNHFYTTLNAIGVTGYANETSSLVGADFFISFINLLGDFILIYRCWMVWGKNYLVVIIPLLSSIGGFSCMIAVLDILLATSPSAPVPPAALVPLGIATYVLPLCTNFIVTALIVFRIWSSSRTVPGSPIQIGQGATRRAMMLVIESGAIYLAVQFVFVVLFSIRHPAEAILAVMATQVYGIAPTLIMIRVGLGISSENSSNTMMSTRIRWIARPGEETGTSATHLADGLVTETDMEGNHTKDSELIPDTVELKDVEFAPPSSYRDAPSSPV